MQVRIHEGMVQLGMIDGEPVEGALYWADRIANNLESNKSKSALRRELREIIWDNFRVAGYRRHAITPRGIVRLDEWMRKALHRLPEKHMVDGREFRKAIDELKAFAYPEPVAKAA